jgi:DNA-binding CsgD family transcriptional regulator
MDAVERLLPDLYALTPLEEFPLRALEIARRVVGGDKADYTEVNLLTGDFRVLVDPEPTELIALEPARVAFMSQHPALQHFFRVDDHEPRLISDFLSQSEFHRLPLYGEFFRMVGVEDQLTVTFADRSIGRIAGISIDRNTRSFQDSDRRFLARLRPHLTAAYLNALTFSQALESAASSRPTFDANLMALSDRQLDVIALIASGCTNAQIGQLLGISAATVRKHVEGILSRLKLPNRTAAAALYLKRTEMTHLESWTAAVDGLVSR